MSNGRHPPHGSRRRVCQNARDTNPRRNVAWPSSTRSASCVATTARYAREWQRAGTAPVATSPHASPAAARSCDTKRHPRSSSAASVARHFRTSCAATKPFFFYFGVPFPFFFFCRHHRVSVSFSRARTQNFYTPQTAARAVARLKRRIFLPLRDH